MTLKTFARRTGWPYDELLATGWVEFVGVLVAMGLTMVVKPVRKTKRAKRTRRTK